MTEIKSFGLCFLNDKEGMFQRSPSGAAGLDHV